jgi:hypothetical protein
MDWSRYDLSSIKKGVRDPGLFIQEFNRIYEPKKYLPIDYLYNGENFFDKDWDNLIILDACRPDFFEKCNDFNKKASRITSLGATSNEFFIKNFRGSQYHDTIYVTGNVSIENIDNKSLHRIVKTYADTKHHEKGFLPETTLNSAVEAYEEYQNKRLVVHFMQPHTPYLSERAAELRERVSDEYEIGFSQVEMVTGANQEYQSQIPNLLQAYKHGYISKNELEQVYADNLYLVLDYVEQLLNRIEGKTIITADHSESFGDFAELYGTEIYGHKGYALSSELREVPWLVLDRDRRQTFAEPPVETVSVSEDVVRENLRDLGYIE